MFLEVGFGPNNDENHVCVIPGANVFLHILYLYTV